MRGKLLGEIPLAAAGDVTVVFCSIMTCLPLVNMTLSKPYHQIVCQVEYNLRSRCID